MRIVSISLTGLELSHWEIKRVMVRIGRRTRTRTRSTHSVVVSSRSFIVRARCADQDGCDCDWVDAWSCHAG
jgi:hypothetical protein